MIGVAAETEGHRVHVQPAGVYIEVGEGETMMSAAQRDGYRWPSVCGGTAECTTCFVVIKSGLEAVAGPDESEEVALELVRMRFPNNSESVRLACQLKVIDDGVEVFRPGVRPTTQR